MDIHIINIFYLIEISTFMDILLKYYMIALNTPIGSILYAIFSLLVKYFVVVQVKFSHFFFKSINSQGQRSIIDIILYAFLKAGLDKILNYMLMNIFYNAHGMLCKHIRD